MKLAAASSVSDTQHRHGGILGFVLADLVHEIDAVVEDPQGRVAHRSGQKNREQTSQKPGPTASVCRYNSRASLRNQRERRAHVGRPEKRGCTEQQTIMERHDRIVRLSAIPEVVQHSFGPLPAA